MDSIKNTFVKYTVDNYKNLKDINLIKFKGRKSVKVVETDDFNPEDYIILSKYNNNYTAIVNNDYKLIFDQNYNIIGYINKFNNEILFDKNEDFTIEKFN